MTHELCMFLKGKVEFTHGDAISSGLNQIKEPIQKTDVAPLCGVATQTGRCVRSLDFLDIECQLPNAVCDVKIK